MACGPEEWQLFMTDEEVKKWEELEQKRLVYVRHIAKIRNKCNGRRRRFNRSSDKETR